MEKMEEEQEEEPAKIIISGAGIVGLVLALALHKHVGVKAELCEQASAFHDGVGAAIGMYPNGLRVIRDISPALLEAIREAGFPYEYRRWMRHDGTEIAVAKETALQRRDDELHSIGIRRWKLQKILFDAVLDAGIPVHFGKRLSAIRINKDGLAECTFEDGTRRLTEILFGADGAKSKTREFVAGAGTSLTYTGTTCLMGIANWPRPARGICFPSACTTRCHGAFFPTAEHEQCFQFHFPIQAENADEGSWGVLDKEDGQEECLRLASRLKNEGWDEEFLEPLCHVNHVVRVGFCLLEPRLERWVSGPVVLLGDAAHPPVPYIGQGAQMGIEDAGIIAQLLKGLCLTGKNGSFDRANFKRVARVYEKMRIPRTTQILQNSKTLGREQQKRAESKSYNILRESSIRVQVFLHGTLPIYLQGVKYDYKEDVSSVLLQVKIRHQPKMFTRLVRKESYSSTPKMPDLMKPHGLSRRVTRPANALTMINEANAMTTIAEEPDEEQLAEIVISGAGIVGLVLALALCKHVGVKAELYEQASNFQDGIGAAIGMYPNGLRVIRDISPTLLEAVREAGYPFQHRRWMRHDGTPEATPVITQGGDCELHSIGIQHCKLQKILFSAVVEAGIKVHFDKRLSAIRKSKDGLVECSFEDGTHRLTEILFGADGAASETRGFVSGFSSTKLKHTGIKCLMGLANSDHLAGEPFSSVCTPTCHACFFPTAEHEQCFQFHLLENQQRDQTQQDILVAEKSLVEYTREGIWRMLGKEDGQEECLRLAKCLRNKGWDKRFLEPLIHANHVVQFRFCLLEPRLERWVSGPVVLLGDAAHPPVPYIGQGPQMGIEDAGIIALLLKGLCLTGTNGTFDRANFGNTMQLYEETQIQRAAQILDSANTMESYNVVKESPIQFQMLFRGTLPMMFPGPNNDYKEAVKRMVRSALRRHRMLSRRQEENESLSLLLNTRASLAA